MVHSERSLHHYLKTEKVHLSWDIHLKGFLIKTQIYMSEYGLKRSCCEKYGKIGKKK